MKPVCYIVGSGDFDESDAELLYNINTDDLLIAADGGFSTLIKYNLYPSALIGDFDSLDDDASYPLHTERLNPVKDITDMQACAEYGISKGYRNFCLLGGTGGRTDHTIANIQLLSGLASTGYSVRMYGKHNVFDVICNNEITFTADRKGYISVFSMSDKSSGVFETNLKYSLENAVLTNTFALGVSNEFIGKSSKISVKDGILLIISERPA